MERAMHTIRQARAEDAEGIARVSVRTWQAAYEDILGREALAGLSVDARRRSMEELFDDPGGSIVLVAERDGEVVGFAVGGPAYDGDLHPARCGEVYAIYISPERWGTGIGAALLAAMAQRLAAAGSEEAVLWVLEENRRGRRFYERAGWRPDGAAKIGEHLGLTVREVRYRAALAALGPGPTIGSQHSGATWVPPVVYPGPKGGETTDRRVGEERPA